ncbi:hypothetical protein Tco_0450855, partial [Tanacetum coccineum]
MITTPESCLYYYYNDKRDLSQRYTIVFQQHQDEPIYDAWTRFKNLIKRVPHHGLDLWSLTQFFYDHVDDYTRMDLDFAADGNLGELSGEEAWEAIENFAQGQKEWDNPPNIISEQEVANLKAQAKRLFGNKDVWVQMHRGIAWDKVENPDPQSTPQVLPSFEEYTPPATYPKEVEETLGIPIEVEPLDETPLEDLGLNTCNHDIPLSSREIPSIDEPEPQPQPLTNCPSSDISLGEEKGPEPHIIRIVLGRRLYLMRRSLEVLRKFHWMILGGRFNQLSHVLLENIEDNVQL